MGPSVLRVENPCTLEGPVAGGPGSLGQVSEAQLRRPALADQSIVRHIHRDLRDWL